MYSPLYPKTQLLFGQHKLNVSISSKIHKYSIFHNVSFVVSKQYEHFLCTKVVSLGYHSLAENSF